MLPAVVETLRRIVAVVCLLAGTWMVTEPGPTLVVARVVDFARERTRSPYLSARSGTLEEFIRHRTQGRTREITEPTWAAFARALRDGSSDAILQRLADRDGAVALVIAHDSLPTPLEAGDAPLVYLHLPHDDLWLSLSQKRPAEIAGLDGGLAHPRRPLGLVLTALAFITVLALPRIRLPADRLVYSKFPAVILPDLLGLACGGFFFALPLLILADRAPGRAPWSMEGGWGALTAALWLMAALCFALNLIALHYSTLHIVIRDDGLVVTKALGSQVYAWSDMALCLPYHACRSALVGMLLIVFARGPAMLGQGLLVANNPERGVEIRMRQGAGLRIMAQAFPGYAQVIAALRQRGINGAALLND